MYQFVMYNLLIENITHLCIIYIYMLCIHHVCILYCTHSFCQSFINVYNVIHFIIVEL